MPDGNQKAEHCFAPVALFVYNRRYHTECTISCLAENDLAQQTRLFIFSDGAKDEKSASQVAEVRKYIHSDSVRNSFKSVEIFESRNNKGVAGSIIDGVSRIINLYGKLIVLEDDLKSTPDFLNFMNDCLDFYSGNEKIWSIGGFSLLNNRPDDYTKDIYIAGRTTSWGWATWADRWNAVDWQAKDYRLFRYNVFKRLQFDRYGNDRSNMLDRQMHDPDFDAWDILFCYEEFKRHMYTVNPCASKISNIGLDGSGVHYSEKLKNSENSLYVNLNGKCNYTLTNDLQINRKITEECYADFNVGWRQYWKRYIASFRKYGFR